MLMICAVVILGNIFFSFPDYYVSVPQTTVTARQTDVSRYAVNINEADKFELLGVEGITERMADEIIKYREEVGRFEDVSEIRIIEGIGKVTYERIRPYITV